MPALSWACSGEGAISKRQTPICRHCCWASTQSSSLPAALQLKALILNDTSLGDDGVAAVCQALTQPGAAPQLEVRSAPVLAAYCGCLSGPSGHGWTKVSRDIFYVSHYSGAGAGAERDHA